MSTSGVRSRFPGDFDYWKVPVAILLTLLVFRQAIEMTLGYGQAASTILIWTIMATGFNILWGYTGLLSFGHAMFVGLGMYAIGIGLGKFSEPFLLAAVVGGVVTVVVTYVIARLIVGKGEIYFAMLTLGFSQVFHFLVNFDPWGLTNGSDGIAEGILPGWLDTFRGQVEVVVGSVQFDWYWLVSAVFLVCMVAIWQIVNSSFGRTIIAIRENRDLAKAMGVDVARYETFSFVLSALFTTVGGVFLALDLQGATLETVHWHTSGDIVVMTILGGAGFFLGPFAGVLSWNLLEGYLTQIEVLNLPLNEFTLFSFEVGGILEFWQFFFGAFFVFIVIVSPSRGVVGLLVDIKNYVVRLTSR